MNRSKLPKCFSAVPKYLKKRRIACLVYGHFALFFMVSHILLTYRQPIEQVLVMLLPRYWLWQLLGVTGLALLAGLLYRLASALSTYRKKWSAARYFMLHTVLGILVPVFLLRQAVYALFFLLGIDIQASGYMANEFYGLCAFILLYHSWLLFFMLSRENSRYRRQLSSLVRRQHRERQVVLQEFMDGAFMIWIEKAGNYRVTYAGEVEAMSAEDEAIWQEVLEFGYIKINRWVYVKKGVIAAVDPANEKLILAKSENHIFQTMDKSQPFYQHFVRKVKLRNSILTFTKRYIHDARARQEDLGD